MKKSDSIFSANWLVIAALVMLWPGEWIIQRSGWLDDYVVRIIMLIGIRITAAVSLQLINGISGQFSLGHAGFMAIGAYAAAYPAREFSQQLSRPLSVLGFYIALFSAILAASAAIYLIYRLLLLPRRFWAPAPVVLALGLGVWAILDFAMAADTAAGWQIWSRGTLMVQQIYVNLMEWLLPVGDRFSQAIPASVSNPACYLIHLLFAGLMAAGAGLLVGVPALRLRGDYLAIATLGFAEIVRVIAQSTPALGGALALIDVPVVDSFAWVYGLAIVTVVCVWRIVHSARGRAMLAVREDEIAAGSLGINPARSKVLAFVVGAFFAGTAGAALAQYEGYVSPSYYDFMQSVELVVIVTLAGAGSITGTILVAVILTWLPEQLRGFEEYRMIVYSLLLITLMLVRPNGLLGNRELLLGGRSNANAAS